MSCSATKAAHSLVCKEGESGIWCDWERLRVLAFADRCALALSFPDVFHDPKGRVQLKLDCLISGPLRDISKSWCPQATQEDTDYPNTQGRKRNSLVLHRVVCCCCTAATPRAERPCSQRSSRSQKIWYRPRDLTKAMKITNTRFLSRSGLQRGKASPRLNSLNTRLWQYRVLALRWGDVPLSPLPLLCVPNPATADYKVVVLFIDRGTVCRRHIRKTIS